MDDSESQINSILEDGSENAMPANVLKPKLVGMPAPRRQEILDLLDQTRLEVEAGCLDELVILKGRTDGSYDMTHTGSSNKYGMIGFAICASLIRSGVDLKTL